MGDVHLVTGNDGTYRRALGHGDRRCLGTVVHHAGSVHVAGYFKLTATVQLHLKVVGANDHRRGVVKRRNREAAIGLITITVIHGDGYRPRITGKIEQTAGGRGLDDRKVRPVHRTVVSNSHLRRVVGQRGATIGIKRNSLRRGATDHRIGHVAQRNHEATVTRIAVAIIHVKRYRLLGVSAHYHRARSRHLLNGKVGAGLAVVRRNELAGVVRQVYLTAGGIEVEILGGRAGNSWWSDIVKGYDHLASGREPCSVGHRQRHGFRVAVAFQQGIDRDVLHYIERSGAKTVVVD